MSESTEDPGAPQPLQFEVAEGVATGTVSCSACHAALTTGYHELNGQPVCAACRAKAEASFEQDQQGSRFIMAAVYGFGAALLGGFLYWGFVKLTNVEFGLVAIAVGWLVGKAVMQGSNMRGGRRYQLLAVALTYFSITISYGALILGQVSTTDALVGWPFLFLLMLASPFLTGFSNVIGWVIIAIGLFEAWKQTRAVPFSTSGPHQFGHAA